MKVRIYCECSGVLRDAFLALGHEAKSVDLQPDAKGSPHHVQGDALEVMRGESGVDLAICHPPCTRLANSGALRLYRGGKKVNGIDPLMWSDMLAGAEFFRRFFEVAERAGILRLCVENPIQHVHAVMAHGCGRPDQIVQPYDFGDDASKATALWLRGLPELKPTGYFAPRYVGDRPRWSNQTDSGQNKLTPSAERGQLRATTYPGIAMAMAKQWGELSR